MIVVCVVSVLFLATGLAAAAMLYGGSTSQGEPMSLAVSGRAVTLFKLAFEERCHDPEGRPTGSNSGRYLHRGRLWLSPLGHFAHSVGERGLLTSGGNQRFNVAISYGGAVRGGSASGTFRGVFRYFTLSHRYFASCTTGTVSWSSHSP